MTVTDTAGQRDDESVTVTVKNVNEPGEITLGALQPKEEESLTATLADPDVQSLQWQSPYHTPRHNQVAVGQVFISNGSTGWTNIDRGCRVQTYTPNPDDEGTKDVDENDIGYYLRATATYTDGERGR